MEQYGRQGLHQAIDQSILLEVSNGVRLKQMINTEQIDDLGISFKIDVIIKLQIPTCLQRVNVCSNSDYTDLKKTTDPDDTSGIILLDWSRVLQEIIDNVFLPGYAPILAKNVVNNAR